ncbi:MAG TPA: FtsX-like permease family protein [Methanobacterium sp.]|nr:FtsX-like permease family protein [Methanobacterium sp.]
MSSWLMSFRNLKRRRSRTAFTVSGIFVGVTLMVILLSMLQGMDISLTNQINGMGGADLTVYNANTQTGGDGPHSLMIKPSDNIPQSNVEKIKNISGVNAVSPTLMLNGFVKGKNNNTQCIINGIEPDAYKTVTGGLNIINGTSLKQGDDNSVVIGKYLSNTLGISVGDKISIGTSQSNTKEFTVSGIFDTGSDEQNTACYVTLNAAQTMSNKQNEVSTIQVKATNPGDIDRLAGVITGQVENVKVITQKAMQEKMSEVTSTMQTFLGAIGLIALIAGSFGVINTMVMSVYERTREIGILKSIGAKNSMVMKMFLSEAILIGLIGSTLGCIVGVLVSYASILALNAMGTQDIMTPIVTPSIIGIGMALGLIMSSLAGIYPAWRASKMNIVEALKHV